MSARGLKVVSYPGQALRAAHRVAVVHGPQRLDRAAELTTQTRADVRKRVELSLARLSRRTVDRDEKVPIEGGRAGRNRTGRALGVVILVVGDTLFGRAFF